MRNFPVELGPLQLDLAVTFGVAREIGEKVADPLLIAQDAALAHRMAAVGLSHKPRFEFTATNIPLVLWLGAKVNHPDLKLSDVQEACIDAGLGVAMGLADGFLAQFIDPRGQEKPEARGDAKPGE